MADFADLNCRLGRLEYDHAHTLQRMAELDSRVGERRRRSRTQTPIKQVRYHSWWVPPGREAEARQRILGGVRPGDGGFLRWTHYYREKMARMQDADPLMR